MSSKERPLIRDPLISEFREKLELSLNKKLLVAISNGFTEQKGYVKKFLSHFVKIIDSNLSSEVIVTDTIKRRYFEVNIYCAELLLAKSKK